MHQPLGIGTAGAVLQQVAGVQTADGVEHPGPSWPIGFWTQWHKEPIAVRAIREHGIALDEDLPHPSPAEGILQGGTGSLVFEAVRHRLAVLPDNAHSAIRGVGVAAADRPVVERAGLPAIGAADHLETADQLAKREADTAQDHPQHWRNPHTKAVSPLLILHLRTSVAAIQRLDRLLARLPAPHLSNAKIRSGP